MLAIIYGTRPEFLKLYPLILEAKRRNVTFVSINTGQHTGLLTEMEDTFRYTPDYKLHAQSSEFSNANLVAKLINDIAEVLKKENATQVIAQGDTFTVMASSLVSFVEKREFYHIEAGLRTDDIMFPFPEEYNRRVVSLGTTKHFAPTDLARRNLLRENIKDKDIIVTGNTIIDLLKYVLFTDEITVKKGKKVFITAHRRENIGAPMRNICTAIEELAIENPEVGFIWSLHPNPKTREIICENFNNYAPNLSFIEPLNYREAVKLMAETLMIISDSGGIQEEAPTLRKKVLILRNETERPEVLDVGCGVLVGNDITKIKEEFYKELHFTSENRWTNPFGQGNAAEIIFNDILQNDNR